MYTLLIKNAKFVTEGEILTWADVVVLDEHGERVPNVKSVNVKIEAGKIPTVEIIMYSCGESKFPEKTVMREIGEGPIAEKIEFPVSEMTIKTGEPFVNKICIDKKGLFDVEKSKQCFESNE